MSNSRIDELRSKFDENPRRYFAPLANEYRKAGDLTTAIALCREHLPKQPGHMSGHIVYGQALYEAGSLDDSRQVFEAALALDPENLIALRHLCDIARASGDNTLARRWYERMLDADPRNDEIAQQLATFFTPAAGAQAVADATHVAEPRSDERTWSPSTPEPGSPGFEPVAHATPAAGFDATTFAPSAPPDADHPVIDLDVDDVSAQRLDQGIAQKSSHVEAPVDERADSQVADHAEASVDVTADEQTESSAESPAELLNDVQVDTPVNAQFDDVEVSNSTNTVERDRIRDEFDEYEWPAEEAIALAHQVEPRSPQEDDAQAIEDAFAGIGADSVDNDASYLTLHTDYELRMDDERFVIPHAEQVDGVPATLSGIDTVMDSGAARDSSEPIDIGDALDAFGAHDPVIEMDPHEFGQPTAAADVDAPPSLAAHDYSAEFEEGLIAPEWPDTSVLFARSETPPRSSAVTPAYSEDAVSAFGREPVDPAPEKTDEEIEYGERDEAVAASMDSGVSAAADEQHVEQHSDEQHADEQHADEHHADEQHADEHHDVVEAHDVTAGRDGAEQEEVAAQSEDVEQQEVVAQQDDAETPQLVALRNDAEQDEHGDDTTDSERVATVAGDDDAPSVSAAASEEQGVASAHDASADDAHEAHEPHEADASQDEEAEAVGASHDDTHSEPLEHSASTVDASLDESATDDVEVTQEFEIPLESISEAPDEVQEVARAMMRDARASGENQAIHVEMHDGTEADPFGSGSARPTPARPSFAQPGSQDSPAFVTETMAELLISQGFVERAATVYEELVRRRPFDQVLVARLHELRERLASDAAPSRDAAEDDTLDVANDVKVGDVAVEAQHDQPQHDERQPDGRHDDEPQYADEQSGSESDQSVNYPKATASASSWDDDVTGDFPAEPDSPASSSAPATFDIDTAMPTPIVGTYSASHASSFEDAEHEQPRISARERFARLASRRVPRRTPPRAAVAIDAPGDGLASLFGAGDDDGKSDYAARAFADAFAPMDEAPFGASHDTPAFVGRTVTGPATPANSAGTAQAHTPSHLPVSHTAPTAPSPVSHPSSAATGGTAGFSFDRFFPDPAIVAPASTPTASAKAPATPPSTSKTPSTTVSPTGSPQSTPQSQDSPVSDDLADFAAWLKGLDKP